MSCRHAVSRKRWRGSWTRLDAGFCIQSKTAAAGLEKAVSKSSDSRRIGNP